MTGRVQVDSVSLARLAGDVSALGGKLRRIASAADAAVAPGQAAWGDDEFGSEFAAGDKGFVAGSTTLSGNTQNIATSFENLGDGLERAADSLARAERANTDSF